MVLGVTTLVRVMGELPRFLLHRYSDRGDHLYIVVYRIPGWIAHICEVGSGPPKISRVGADSLRRCSIHQSRWPQPDPLSHRHHAAPAPRPEPGTGMAAASGYGSSRKSSSAGASLRVSPGAGPPLRVAAAGTCIPGIR